MIAPMHCSFFDTTSSRSLLGVLTAVMLGSGALVAGPVAAQGVYRVVGPDGRVTFSDRPPQANSQSAVSGSVSSEGSASGNTVPLAQLPYELRQTATRYPVTLYSAKECQPCDEARNYLKGRGVPFSERTVETNTDLEALKKLSGQDNLPFATIGSQHLKGFGEDSWAQYLKAAGYPAQSALPANYRAPTARPLTTPAPAEKAKPAENNATRSAAPTSPQAAPRPGTPTPNNPAGLRF